MCSAWSEKLGFRLTARAAPSNGPPNECRLPINGATRAADKGVGSPVSPDDPGPTGSDASWDRKGGSRWAKERMGGRVWFEVTISRLPAPIGTAAVAEAGGLVLVTGAAVSALLGRPGVVRKVERMAESW